VSAVWQRFRSRIRKARAPDGDGFADIDSGVVAAADSARVEKLHRVGCALFASGKHHSGRRIADSISMDRTSCPVKFSFDVRRAIISRTHELR